MPNRKMRSERDFIKIAIPYVISMALLVVHREIKKQPEPIGDPIPTAPPAKVLTPPTIVSTPEILPTLVRIPTPKH